MILRLATLPLEILENVISNIEKSRDLLALALTSSIFYDIIVPHHIQFREIRCKTNTVILWKRLEERHVLCSRVRHIEIFSSHPNRFSCSGRYYAIIPHSLLPECEDVQKLWDHPRKVPALIKSSWHEFSSIFQRIPIIWKQKNVPIALGPTEQRTLGGLPWDAEIDSIRAVPGALAHMHNLTHFSVVLGWVRGPLVFNLLSCVVTSCVNLSHVEFRWMDAESSAFSPLWKLRNIKAFTFAVTHDEPEFNSYKNDLSDLLLHHGDGLEYLYLRVDFRFVHPTTPLWVGLDGLLLGAKWPHLHSLILSGRVKFRSSKFPAWFLWDFFRRNTRLRCVQFGTEESYPFYAWKEDMVPISLRSLGLSISPRLIHENVTQRNLWGHLERLKFSHIFRPDQWDLFCLADNLRIFIITVVPSDVERLLMSLPETLGQLCVKILTFFPGSKRWHITKHEPFTRHIFRLKELTHLCLFAEHEDSLQEFRNTKSLGALATAPKLKYLSFVDLKGYDTYQGLDEWICINRHETGGYAGYEIVPPADGYALTSFLWGDFPPWIF